MDEAKLCPTCGSLLSSGQVKKVLHQMHIDAEAAERKAKIDAEKKFGDALAMVERAKKAAEERSTRAEAETSRLKKNQERKDEATKQAAERKAKVDAEKKFGDALAMVERAKKAAEERSTRAEAETSRLKKNQERKDEATKQAAERKAKVDAEKKFGDVLTRAERAKKAAEEKSARTERANERLRKKVIQANSVMEAKDQSHFGPEGEEELMSILKLKFEKDVIQRLNRTGDVSQAVRDGGREIGLILYECKNSSAWRAQYLDQLRREMRLRGTPYGILVSKSLPSGKESGFIEDGEINGDTWIVVVKPSAVSWAGEVVRRVIVTSARRGADKTQIMKFLNSDKFKLHFGSATRSVQEMATGIIKEKEFHMNDWRRREANNEMMKEFLIQMNEGIKPSACRLVSVKAA